MATLTCQEEEYLQTLEAKFGKDIANKQRAIFESQQMQKEQQTEQEQPKEIEESDEEDEFPQGETWRHQFARQKAEDELLAKKKVILEKIEQKVNEDEKESVIEESAQNQIKVLVDKANEKIREQQKAINAKLDERNKKVEAINKAFDSLKVRLNCPDFQGYVKEFISILNLMYDRPLENVEWQIRLLMEKNPDGTMSVAMLRGNCTVIKPKEEAKQSV